MNSPLLLDRRETRAFLRLNDYYLVFAEPTIPFVGRGGELMVPACTLARLMGMYAEFDAGGAGEVIISGRVKRAVSMIAGRPVANIGGRDARLSEPPIRIPQQAGVHDLLAPVSAVLAALGVSGRRDAGTHTLAVESSQLLPQIAGLPEQAGYNEPGAFTPDLAPVSLELRPRGGLNRSAGEDFGEILFTVRNISGKAIPRGQAWIKTIDYTRFGGVAVGGVPYNSPDIHDPEPSPVPAGGTITVTVAVGSGYSDRPRFILAQPQRYSR